MDNADVKRYFDALFGSAPVQEFITSAITHELAYGHGVGTRTTPTNDIEAYCPTCDDTVALYKT